MTHLFVLPGGRQDFLFETIYIRAEPGDLLQQKAGYFADRFREIGYPLRSRDVNMLGWRTRHPIPKAGSTTRAP